MLLRDDVPRGGSTDDGASRAASRPILATCALGMNLRLDPSVSANHTRSSPTRGTDMRSTRTAGSLFLILAAACSGDYGRSTSPNGMPPGTPYPTDSTGTPPAPPARTIVSLAIAAPDSLLVAGDSMQLSVFGLDASG